MTSADVFSPEQRSAIMRAVKSSGTAPERAVRAAACALGFARRYRLGRADLPGKPDLAFGALRKVVFVHGCFWHGHACKRGARAPKTNARYWCAKIARNVTRDAATARALKHLGWAVLVLWECEIRDSAHFSAKLAKFLHQPSGAPLARKPHRQIV